MLCDHLPDQEFVYSIAASPATAGSPIGAALAAHTSGLYHDGGLTLRKETIAISPVVTTTVIVSPDSRNDHNVFAAAGEIRLVRLP